MVLVVQTCSDTIARDSTLVLRGECDMKQDHSMSDHGWSPSMSRSLSAQSTKSQALSQVSTHSFSFSQHPNQGDESHDSLEGDGEDSDDDVEIKHEDSASTNSYDACAAPS
jgi:hypothetical protein